MRKVYIKQKLENRMNKKAVVPLLYILIIALAIAGVWYYASNGSFQGLDIIGGENYIQAPTFYYYHCDPARQPTESTHTSLSNGNSGGFILAPANTPQWDLYIRQTENIPFYDIIGRRFVYQICHNDGANCDSRVYVPQGSVQTTLNTIHISNLLTTDRVFINYQRAQILNWIDQSNGAEWYQTYTPFILWKHDMFGGGDFPYTTINQGCNFPTSTSQLAPEAQGVLYRVSNFVNSLTGTMRTMPSQVSENNHLGFYQKRNFIGTYVPLATANVNFVTYNGQQGYCLNRQIFSITTATTNGATYRIVDSNFNTQLASSVTCCPGEHEPTRRCNSNFQWENINQGTSGQCSPFNPCEGSTWADYTSTSQIRYNCVSGQCVSQTRNVECTTNSACGAGRTCDPLSHTCQTLNPGQVVPQNNSCPTGTRSVTKYTQTFWSIIGISTPTMTQSCEPINFWSDYGLYIIIGGTALLIWYFMFYRRNIKIVVAVIFAFLLYLSFYYLGAFATTFLFIVGGILLIIFLFRRIILRLII